MSTLELAERRFQERLDRADPPERAHLLRCSKAYKKMMAETEPLRLEWERAVTAALAEYAETVKDSERRKNRERAAPAA